MPGTKNYRESTGGASKRNTGSGKVRKTGTVHKKQQTVDVKVPTAREKAKAIDDRRKDDTVNNEFL